VIRASVKFRVSGHTEQVGRNFISAVVYYLSISSSVDLLLSSQRFMCSRHEEAMFVGVSHKKMHIVRKIFKDVIQKVRAGLYVCMYVYKGKVIPLQAYLA
jgi:hypothetical protein